MANRLSGCGGSVGGSLSLVDRSAMLLVNDAKFGRSGKVAFEVKKVGVATSSLFGRIGSPGWKGVDVCSGLENLIDFPSLRCMAKYSLLRPSAKGLVETFRGGGVT